MNTLLMLLMIVGAVAVVAMVVIFLFSRPRRPRDLGSVSSAWTTEHNSTTHGGDSSQR
jgi:hypothetical protein